jgi:hypothetical protein
MKKFLEVGLPEIFGNLEIRKKSGRIWKSDFQIFGFRILWILIRGNI